MKKTTFDVAAQAKSRDRGDEKDNTNQAVILSSVKTSPRKRHSSYVGVKDENQIRGNWTGKFDFLLSCLSFAVGLGNVWRFPYMCYRNGGGAFVIPFMIMLLVAGIPLFFLETAFGQFASCGVVPIWQASPLFQGIGASMCLVSFFVCIYYNVIIAWTFFYLFASFTTELPWQTCNNAWNTPECRTGEYRQSQNSCWKENGTWYNQTCYGYNESLPKEYYDLVMGYNSHTLSPNNVMNYSVVNNSSIGQKVTKFRSPADEYFHNYMLNISDGFHDMGAPRWQLVLCLLLAWIIICVCMIKGIKSSGRAVYFTSTFPYLVLLILFIRGLTLPGSVTGILFYITPRWEKLLTAQVWADAAIQIFFSLAPGWGPLITLSSYNKFKNNCLRDAYVVTLGDCFTSLFAGLVIFSIIGFIAHELDTEVANVLDEGPGLAFIVYPEVVTRLPASPIWAVLFFLMLITLGIGTQFALINTVHTTIIDVFPKFFHKGWRPSFLMIGLCLLNFILGLSMCTRGGIYILTLMDAYSATYSVLVIALTECIALSWVYGYEQLRSDFKLMLGKSIGIFWKISWKFVSPCTLVAICIFQWIQFKPNYYRNYEFPIWSELLGWCISLVAILCIPGAAIYKIATVDSSLTIIERIKLLSQPAKDWGPGLFRTEGTKEYRHSHMNGAGDSVLVEQKDAYIPLQNMVKATIELNDLEDINTNRN